MTNDQILARLAERDMLPTFPRIADEMRGTIKDPTSSASDQASHGDPAMAGEVLRIADTAFPRTGSFKAVARLEHATAEIGPEDLSGTILPMPFTSMTGGDGRQQNVRAAYPAHRPAKTIDPEEDLASFDDFSAQHRVSIESAAGAAGNLPPSEETEFPEVVYNLLKEAKAYREAVTKGEYDKSSCS